MDLHSKTCYSTRHKINSTLIHAPCTYNVRIVLFGGDDNNNNNKMKITRYMMRVRDDTVNRMVEN